jgi:hypothetical protein
MADYAMAAEITDSTTMAKIFKSLLAPEPQRACWESIQNYFTDSMHVSET